MRDTPTPVVDWKGFQLPVPFRYRVMPAYFYFAENSHLNYQRLLFTVDYLRFRADQLINWHYYCSNECSAVTNRGLSIIMATCCDYLYRSKTVPELRKNILPVPFMHDKIGPRTLSN